MKLKAKPNVSRQKEIIQIKSKTKQNSENRKKKSMKQK